MKNGFLFPVGLFFAFCLVPLTAGSQVTDTTRTLKEVDSLLSIATDLWRQKHFREALPPAQRATEMSKQHLWEGNPKYSAALHRLASIYKGLNQYSVAEDLYRQAIRLRERNKNLDYASSLNNLGVLYVENGNYDAAESLFLKVKPIREKEQDKNPYDYAMCLSNLAVLYLVKGNFVQAERMFLAAESMLRKGLPQTQPTYVSTLNNLAGFYTSIGAYEKAETLYLQVKSIQGTAATNDLDRASGLNSMGYLYLVKGDYDKAEPLFLEARSIWEQTVGKEHPYYASTLNNLAILYLANGNDYAKAKPLFLAAKSSWEKILGKENATYTAVLNNLAYIYNAEGEDQKALSYFLTANAINRKLLQQALTYSLDQEMLQYANLFKQQTGNLLSFAQFHPIDSLAIAAYDNALFQKNALLDAAAVRERAMAQADTATQRLHSEWKAYNFRLNKQYTQLHDTAQIAVLESKLRVCEKELIRRSPTFVESRRSITWQQVRDCLQPGQVAIEFIAYQYDSAKTPDHSLRYAALVLRKGDASPIFVPLCEEKQLKSIIGTPPASNRAEVWDAYVQRVYAAPRAGHSSLYGLIWKPLEPYLESASSPAKERTGVFFSPDGLLHLLNLCAIRDPGGKCLGQQYQLMALASTRRLVQPAWYRPAGNSIALFGGIRYEVNTEINFPPCDSTLRNGDRWIYLPGSKVEVEGIALKCQKQGFQVTLLTGYNATEEAVKSLGTLGKPSPRVLHLATHGFFSADTTTQTRHNGLLSEQIFRPTSDPMRRSGLVLAGANCARSANAEPKDLLIDGENGILTAREIETLNLSNTELVVLSACNTGQGDVATNEGVYGLQRAFKIAGVKYIIMSLWSVPDRATQQLMDAFYTNWLEKGLDIPAAFRLAQEHVTKLYPSPFYWSGFVLLE